MQIGFTGTREGMTIAQLAALTEMLRGSNATLHHGDCVGADAEAHDIADAVGLTIVIHPPDNLELRAFKLGRYIWGPLPYLERNREIVRCADYLIAAPAEDTEQARGGTWHAVRYARKRRKSIVIIWPNGVVRREV